MAHNLTVGWKKLCLEFLVLAVCYAIVLVYRYGNINPTQRGFFCDDESIRYPNVGQRISEIQVVVTSYILALVVIMITELWKHCGSEENKNAKFYFIGKSTPGWIYYIYIYLVGFLFAMAVTMAIKFIIGTQIGRFRPNFLALCQPDLNLSNCAEFGHTYITNYTCTAGSSMDSYGRQSFISAHTAVSACAAIFLVMYICSRWNRQGFRNILTSFVSFILVLAPLVVGMTRISDNMHHPTDVLAGLILGIVTAFLSAKYLCSLGCRSQYSEIVHVEGQDNREYAMVEAHVPNAHN